MCFQRFRVPFLDLRPDRSGRDCKALWRVRASSSPAWSIGTGRHRYLTCTRTTPGIGLLRRLRINQDNCFLKTFIRATRP